MWALVFISLCLLHVCEGFQVREFPVGSKLNPGKSCQDIKERGGTVTANYYIALGQQTLLVHCDQDTAGGGWTLVYSYTFTDFSHFKQNSNALTPRPNWSLKMGNTRISTTPPRSETDYNAMDFNSWKKIGNEFMIKSNVNNWVACIEGGGSLVNWVNGSIKCKLVKNVTGECSNIVPNLFSIVFPGESDGPLLSITDIATNPVKSYYYLESSTENAYPTHDPCGKDADFAFVTPNNPHGNIYVR